MLYMKQSRVWCISGIGLFREENMTRKILTICAVVGLFVCDIAAQESLRKTNITRDDRESWRKVLQWPDEFENRWKSSPENANSESGGLRFYQLGRGKYIVAINTWNSIYQPFYVYMYYDELTKSAKPARLLEVRRYERNSKGKVSSRMMTEVEGFPAFDVKRKELDIFSKARATGDCGSHVTYRLVRGLLMPAEARVQACYDDNSKWVTDPNRWEKVHKLQ